MNTQTLLMIVGGVAILAAAVFAFAVVGRKRTARLKQHFGAEYEEAVSAQGGSRRAEAHLAAREKRVEKLKIHPVPADLRAAFAASWRDVQARFVDEPGDAVVEADALVRKVMEARGYPMDSFEQGAADISVDHPRVVANYRAAHGIVLKRERGEASTEDLRQAFVCDRALFDELLAAEPAPAATGA